ncbi:MAG: heme-dependent oxidative N-demethylase subunit alpha family protein [Pseudomonadales bacterium]
MNPIPAPYSGCFDWQQPPFADGHCGARLALQPVATGHWLTAAPGAAVPAYKREMHQRHGVHCSAVWPRPDAVSLLQQAERRLVELLQQVQVPLPTPLAGDIGVPLMTAALAVHEDLCLMAHLGGEYRLIAANLCMPSYWSLGAKLGEPLRSIHEPVTDLDAAQLQRMEQFFLALPDDRVFERRNWFLHGSGEGYEPTADALVYEDYRGPWFLRSERQTLRRLGTELVLFAIRVDIEPMAKIAGFPQAHADLQLALHNLEGTALLDFGGAPKRAAALAALNLLEPAV